MLIPRGVAAVRLREAGFVALHSALTPFSRLTRALRVVSLATVFAVLTASLPAQKPVTLRVGIALPEGNSQVGLPPIAELLSSEALVGLEPNGRPVPRLAKRWKVSTDGRELRFTLPTRLTFHDGTRATAKAIAARVREALQSSRVLQFHPRLADFYEISAESDADLVLRSRSARILALEELADVTLRAGSAGAGLGPFVVDSLNADGIRLHGFAQYFEGAPAVERLEFLAYRSQRAAWTGMMRDEIDALYEVNREAVEFVERESRVQTRSFLRPYVSALMFNVSKPVFRDPDTRKALGSAIDRSAVVSSVYRERAQPADGPVAPTYWALSKDLHLTTYDPHLARSLLARHAIVPAADRMPARIRFNCLVPTFETQPLDRIALVVQKQLYDFGIDVQLQQVSVRELLPRLASGDFEAVLTEFFAVTPSWLSSFWHSPAAGAPTLIKSGYSAADHELEAMDLAISEEELRQRLAAVYRKLADDPPAIFIAWPEVTRAVSTRFEVPVEQGRDIMGANLWLWRPAKRQ